MRWLILCTLPCLVWVSEYLIVLTLYIKFSLNPDDEPVQSVKKLPLCFYKKMGYMKNGKVDMALVRDQVKELGPPDAAEQIIEPCEHIEQKENDEEDNAFKVFKCFLDVVKKLIMKSKRPYWAH